MLQFKTLRFTFLAITLISIFFPFSMNYGKSKPSPKVKMSAVQELSFLDLKTLEIDIKTKKFTKMNDALKKSLGKKVSLKGFMMPLEYSEKEISEFLLMPYVPSCAHIPPPPSNQLVLVKMKKGLKTKSTFNPVEVQGTLSIEENKDLESSFKMEGLSSVELDPKDQSFSPPPMQHPGGIPN